MCLFLNAELDSPNSMKYSNPYGRRRKRGKNVRVCMFSNFTLQYYDYIFLRKNYFQQKLIIITYSLRNC